MITPMERVEIVFLRSELFDVVPFLQDQGMVHLEDVPLALEEHPGYLHRVHLPQARKDELAALEEVQGLLNEALPLSRAKPGFNAVVRAGRDIHRDSVETLRARVIEWHRTLRSLSRRRLNAQDNAEILKNYRRILQQIAPVLEERNAALGTTARALVLQESKPEALESFEKRIVSDIGPECSVSTRRISRGETAVVITFPEGKGDAVGGLLEQMGIAPVEVPDPALRGVSVQQAIERVDGKLKELKATLDALRSQQQVFDEQHGAGLHAIQRIVGDRIGQYTVVEQFAQSEMVGVVHGWVPVDQVAGLESELKKTFGARAALGTLSKKEVDVHRIPTQLRNHPIFKPFQLLLGIFDPPKYGTFDPTWVVAISFIMFYGFVLGDFGYGIFIIAVAWYVKRRNPHKEMLCDVMTIAQWMGASSIVWGVIYGEGFGDLPYKYFGFAPFHRVYELELLLALAIGYGLVHVPIGLIIGTIEGYRHNDPHHAEEKLGMLLGLVALGLAVLTLSGLWPLAPALGYLAAAAVFIASVFFLVRSMGGMAAMGVMEIIGGTANILSYARLMATGIASVIVADLANLFIYAYDDNLLLLLLVGIPAAGIVHLINIGIGLFSPTIHALRLNYVEFLPKFYEPEGRNYQPFRKELAW